MITFKFSMENININKLHDELGDLGSEYHMPFTEEEFSLEFPYLSEDFEGKEELIAHIESIIAAHDPTVEEPLTDEERLDRQELLILQLCEVINNG